MFYLTLTSLDGSHLFLYFRQFYLKVLGGKISILWRTSSFIANAFARIQFVLQHIPHFYKKYSFMSDSLVWQNCAK